MQNQHHGFRLQRYHCILASALLGTGTMFAVLVAAIVGAPESAFVGICAGGLGAMLAAALVSQFVHN
ncbi:MAG TPA: hypothetical protein VNT75_15355 [Symbiobacteriaceae bacterium]|nr:hypothetical protein [Symbiobacteriaceae bacterium]